MCAGNAHELRLVVAASTGNDERSFWPCKSRCAFDGRRGAVFLILELNTPFGGVIQIASAPMDTALRHLGR